MLDLGALKSADKYIHAFSRLQTAHIQDRWRVGQAMALAEVVGLAANLRIPSDQHHWESR